MACNVRNGVSAAIVTFNTHLGKSGLLTEGKNSVFFIQAPSKKKRNSDLTTKKKIEVVESALKFLSDALDSFEKFIIYAGEGLGAKIIRLVDKYKLPAEKVIFLTPQNDWGEKENEVLHLSGLSKAHIVKCDIEISDVMWNIHRDILTKGVFPQ